MPQLLTNVIASPRDRQIFITANSLTEGDIIKHFTGDVGQVISEPEYTRQGITFEVMWLNVKADDNTQSVTFAPAWRFELVAHQVAKVEAA